MSNASRDKGIEPEGYVLYSYAAIQAWQQAMQKAGSKDPAKVQAALNALEFNTVIGKFKFDSKGDPNLPPYAFFKWSGGKYSQIN